MGDRKKWRRIARWPGGRISKRVSHEFPIPDFRYPIFTLPVPTQPCLFITSSNEELNAAAEKKAQIVMLEKA